MVFDLYYGVWRIKNALISKRRAAPRAPRLRCASAVWARGRGCLEGGRPSEPWLCPGACPPRGESGTPLSFRNYAGNTENVLPWHLQTLSTTWYHTAFRQLHFQFSRDTVFAGLFLKSILTVSFWALITYVSKQGWRTAIFFFNSQ